MDCIDGNKLGVCTEASHHLQIMKDLLISVSNDLLDNVDLKPYRIEKLRQDRLMLNRQIPQLEKYLQSCSVNEKGSKSNFASAQLNVNRNNFGGETEHVDKLTEDNWSQHAKIDDVRFFDSPPTQKPCTEEERAAALRAFSYKSKSYTCSDTPLADKAWQAFAEFKSSSSNYTNPVALKARHDDTSLSPVELCMDCIDGNKLGVCTEASHHLQIMKDLLISVSNDLLDNVDLKPYRIEKLRQDRLMLNRQIPQLEKYLQSCSVNEKGSKSNFASAQTTTTRGLTGASYQRRNED